jgi:hypothetical protein
LPIKRKNIKTNFSLSSAIIRPLAWKWGWNTVHIPFQAPASASRASLCRYNSFNLSPSDANHSVDNIRGVDGTSIPLTCDCSALASLAFHASHPVSLTPSWASGRSIQPPLTFRSCAGLYPTCSERSATTTRINKLYRFLLNFLYIFYPSYSFKIDSCCKKLLSIGIKKNCRI